jgi:hypothetical protein
MNNDNTRSLCGILFETLRETESPGSTYVPGAQWSTIGLDDLATRAWRDGIAKKATCQKCRNAYVLQSRAGELRDGTLKPQPPESLLRGLAALLAVPFLLLAALGIGLWVVAPHKGIADILDTARRRRRWWLAVDIAAAVLGVATLDWLVDAF